MKKNFFISLALCSLLWMTNGHAQENTPLTETIKGAIKDLVEDNAVFASERARHDFKEFLDIQNPRVTMVLCSDSRVQTDNFSQGAENDIFVARNIGNQFITTAGSIEYGVNVLKTPVLIIVGHSHCGAIKAAMGDVTSLPEGIRKEVETIDVKAAKDDKQGVIENVHYQVEKALNQFKDKVNTSQLAVVGAVYDFRNDYGYGYGQLIIVDLNGEKNPEKIKNSHYFDNIKKVSIGVN
ncbi:carbonic anhydrase [Kamptonema cortianum]|jgi:carbonic anhydrase|nr:carbonic anhydrase [Geitlerinema splendidum]MDK3160006.1 carbonic anhydrase [Kamptonema cortianum]